MHAHLHILTHKAQGAPPPFPIPPKKQQSNTIVADGG